MLYAQSLGKNGLYLPDSCHTLHQNRMNVFFSVILVLFNLMILNVKAIFS